MSSIYLKVTIEEKCCRYPKFKFSNFKKSVSRPIFRELNWHRYHTTFKLLVATQKLGGKLYVAFLHTIILNLKEIMMLGSSTKNVCHT